MKTPANPTPNPANAFIPSPEPEAGLDTWWREDSELSGDAGEDHPDRCVNAADGPAVGSASSPRFIAEIRPLCTVKTCRTSLSERILP